MGIRSLTNPAVELPLNGRWLIEVETTDDDGLLVDGAPTVVVTLPDNSTAGLTFENVITGYYRVGYDLTSAGRYVAIVTAEDHGVLALTAFITASTAATGMPTVADYRDYDEDGGGSWTDAQIQSALDAESAAQRAICRVAAVYPADLRQALLRRVARNLEMRRFSLSTPVVEGEDLMRPPVRDPEVRRLEAPHRKLVIA